MLANASIDMKVFREETFGPAIPLFRFDSAAEAVKLANDTEYGLAAYFWTQARPRRARAPDGVCRHALVPDSAQGCWGARLPGPAPRPAPCWTGHTSGRPPGAVGSTATMWPGPAAVQDLARAWRVAEELEYGMVGINDVAITSEVAPFGGIKQSGLGREQSKYGLDEYLYLKYIQMGNVGSY